MTTTTAPATDLLQIIRNLLDEAPRDAFGVFYDADAFAQDVARILGKPNPDDPDAE